MCKRNSDDPLVRMFLDRYKLNLLALPRERAFCGEIYVRQRRRVSSGAALDGLVEPNVTLPPTFEGEQLSALEGELSNSVQFSAGISLLRGFLTAIGAGAILSKLSAHFERGRTAHLRFSFGEVTRDSMNPTGLATALQGRRLVAKNPLVQPNADYFVTAAVVRSPAIGVVAEDERKRRVELGAEALQVAGADTDVALESGANGELTFRGTTPLAIGLELYELRFDEAGKLSMLAQDPRDPVHAGKEAVPDPAFLDPDGNVLLELADDA